MRVPARVHFRFVYRLLCVAAGGALLASCAPLKSAWSSAADSVSGVFGRAPSPAKSMADDGPPDNAPADAESVADAVPREEPLHATANRALAGQSGHDASGALLGEFSQRGRASWYGKRHQGTATASGERFDPLAMTAAHPRLPIPSYARVANVRTTRSVIVRINDRGPADGSVIALSYAAAAKLGIATPEGGDVEVTRVMPGEYATLQAQSLALANQRAPGAAAAPEIAPVAATAAPVAATAAPVGSPAATTAPAASPASAPPASAATPEPPIRVPPARPIAASSARPPKVAGDAAPASRASSAVPPPAVAATAAPPAAAAAAPAAASGVRWSVQVGVFAVPENAETVRRQVAAQLAQGMAGAPLAERTPRVELRGNRHFVLVGDAPDRAAAESLAARVRRAVKHDVVIVRR